MLDTDRPISNLPRFERPALYDKGGELALIEISRTKPILMNRVAPEIEPAVVELALNQTRSVRSSSG